MARGPQPKNPVPAWALALKMRRVQLGNLTQEEIQARAEDVISQGTVSDLERGKITLDSLNVKRASALARALEWTLSDMQRATGVDLGISEAEDTAREATPVYRLQDLTNPKRQPDSTVFVLPNPKVPNPRNYVVALADSDEMASDRSGSIHSGDLLFIDTNDIAGDRENNNYVIEHAGHIHVRRLTKLPNGLAFTADNPAYAYKFIPAEQARVLGRIYRRVRDGSLDTRNRLTN